jgi:hypothetical protein
LGIKEQETRLTFHERDDDGDDEKFSSYLSKKTQ